MCSEARGTHFRRKNSELEVCAKNLLLLLNFQLWAASEGPCFILLFVVCLQVVQLLNNDIAPVGRRSEPRAVAK